jgi:hypothetical protein
MKKIYYEKVGRKYVPIAEYDNEYLDSFPKGAHLVMCYPGGSSRKFNINPDLAPMIAAGRYAENAISAALVKASEARPKQVPLTEEQQKAWKHMKEAFGTDMFYIQYPSAHDAIDAGLKAMQDEANKLLENPAVKKAYDHFMLMCELVKTHENV